MRIRFPRRRLNPVPGTKSTQSRYFLGYFVFVDEPDIGYAVSIRAAGPQGRMRQEMGLPSDIIQQRALVRAEEYAQKLSDKTDRQVAFMPILPQATKYEAVEHLYGGAGSRRYGGPNARGKVTLSRTRLPNRAVNQTALVSVRAHWESLYGEGQVGQTGWPRTSPAFRTPEAFSTGPGSLRFSPGTVEEAGREVAEVDAAKIRDRLKKIEALARDQRGMPEGETARVMAESLRERLRGAVAFDPATVLMDVELEDTPLNTAWVVSLAKMMNEEDQTTDKVAYIGNLFLGFIFDVGLELRKSDRMFNAVDALLMLRDTKQFQDVREALKSVGIRTDGQRKELLRRSIQVLQAEGEMQSA